MFVKTAALVLSLVPAFALASQTKNFASCYGDHHGSYLKLWSVVGSASSDIVQVNIAVSDDSDRAPVIYTVKEVTKGGAVLPVKSYSWAIRQAIRSEASDGSYGFVKVTAQNAAGKTLYMNVNKFVGPDAMAIDGYIESLTCPVASIQD